MNVQEIEIILTLENIFTNFSNKSNLQAKLHDIFANTDTDFNTKMYCFITEFLIQENIDDEHSFLKNLETKYELPVVKWIGSRSVKEFSLIFFESGIFASIVSDAIEMSKKERAIKWEQELNKWNQDRQYQLETHEKQQKYIENMKKCRIQNEIAYNLLKEHFNSLLEKNEEWSQVVMSSLDKLKNWNKVSWTCVRIDNLHPLQKRAVVHKIEQFEKSHGTTHLPNNMRYRCMHANWSLLDENDVNKDSFIKAEQELKKGKKNENSFLNGRRKHIDQSKDVVTTEVILENNSELNKEIEFYHERIIDKNSIISNKKNKKSCYIYKYFINKIKFKRIKCQISSSDIIQQ